LVLIFSVAILVDDDFLQMILKVDESVCLLVFLVVLMDDGLAYVV